MIKKALINNNFNEATSSEAYIFCFALLANEIKFHKLFESYFGNGRTQTLKRDFVNSNTRYGLGEFKFNDSMLHNLSLNLNPYEFKKTIIKYCEALAARAKNLDDIEYIKRIVHKYFSDIDKLKALHSLCLRFEPHHLPLFFERTLQPMNAAEQIAFIKEIYLSSEIKNIIALYMAQGGDYIEKNFSQFTPPDLLVSTELIDIFYHYELDLTILKQSLGSSPIKYYFHYLNQKLQEQQSHIEREKLSGLLGESNTSKMVNKL